MPFKTANPLRLNQQDVARLPARYLILISALYIIAGLAWRGVWRQEAASFGTMLTMAQGSLSDWLFPNVAGLYTPELGPLPYWIGALSIKLLSGFADPFNAAQTAIAIQDAASIYLLWLTVYRLGKRDEMQPQRLAFGGEPSARAYSRMLADSAVLLFIATYGIATNAHDTSEGATLLLVFMLWLCGTVSSLDRPATARWLWGFGMAGMGLTLPFSLFVFFVFATLGILFFTHWRHNSGHVAPVVIALGLGLPAAWLLQFRHNPTFALEWLNHQRFSPLSLNDAKFFARNIFVFTWPIAPLSIWCLWRWRTHWHKPMMFLGLVTLLTPLLHMLITGQRFDLSMLMLVPALLILAPFGLATLNRGRANIIDWFSVITFSLLAVGIWLMWLASWTGFPAQWAHNIYKLAPNFTPIFKWWPFIIAIIVSAAWGILLFWRARYESRAIWKSIVFSSGGLVLVWTLLATLGMPWLDYTRNYASVGKSLSQVIPSKVSCVRAVDLSESARGAIYYYARVPFVANDATFDNVTCPYIITHERNLKASDRVMIDQTITFDQRDWQVVWTGERIAERENLLVLLRQK